MTTAVTGTPPLLRATTKQDGRRFAPWILITTALAASSVLVYPWIFPTQQDREALATAISSNPALGLIFGPANDLTTADGFTSWRALALGGFLAALGVIFTLTRATRAQEDSGQAELLASGVMGRAARLMTAVVICLAASLLLGVVVSVVTVLCGGDPNASLLLGATMTATGWMFTAVAAIAAQLGSDARAANSLAVATLAVLYVLRGVAYAVEAPPWTIWVNPLGWMTETQPAIANTWWPLLLAVALTAVLLAFAFALQGRRDFGVGAIAPRPGPDRGKDRSTWRLALRLNRGPMVTWAVAFLALGCVFGYFATSITDILASDTAVQQILAAGATSNNQLVNAFILTILSIVGILASIPGVQIMLKVRTEEMHDRVEPIIATPVTRPRYYASNVLAALSAPAVYVLIAGVGIATIASAADIGVAFTTTVTQALVTVPAVWTVIAVAVAVVGARPRVILAAWFGVLLSFVLTILGPTFKLPDWVLAISPFWHIPVIADPRPDWSGLGWIALAAAILIAVGFAGFRRRDLAR